MSVYGVKPSPLGIVLVLGAVFLVFYTFSGDSSNARETVDPEMVSLRELLAVSIQAAENGGEKVEEVHKMKDIGQENKGDLSIGGKTVVDPLTLGDQYSHEAIVGTIRKAYGNTVFVYSEEKDSHKLDLSTIEEPNYGLGDRLNKYIGKNDELVSKEDVTVWVDPLDATKEYTENLLNYVTTMVCVAVKGVPVIGVIHKPFRNDNMRTVWTWVDHGANIIDKSKDKDSDGIIIVSRSHKGDVEAAVKAQLGGHAIGAGGAGYKVEELFGYPSDNDEKTTPAAYVHTTLIKKWDICAGNALLNHFNGKMTSVNGDDINYDKALDPKHEGGLIAALHDHQKYVDAFKSYKKPESNN